VFVHSKVDFGLHMMFKGVMLSALLVVYIFYALCRFEGFMMEGLTAKVTERDGDFAVVVVCLGGG
jgi:hypothetical protein